MNAKNPICAKASVIMMNPMPEVLRLMTLHDRANHRASGKADAEMDKAVSNTVETGNGHAVCTQPQKQRMP